MSSSQPLAPKVFCRILDSGAGVNIYSSSELVFLSNFESCNDVVMGFDGNSSGVHEKAFHKEFGDGYLNPNVDVTHTIISMNQLVKTHEMRGSSNKYICFVPRNHRTLKSWFAAAGQSGVYYLRELGSEPGALAGLVRQYSRLQAEAVNAAISQRRPNATSRATKQGVAEAINFHRCLAHINFEAIRQGMLQGVWGAVKFTMADLNAAALLPCLGCIEGKTPRPASPRPTEPPPPELPAGDCKVFGDEWHCDLFSESHRTGGVQTFFLAVDFITRYDFVVPVDGKDETSVYEGLQQLYDFTKWWRGRLRLPHAGITIKFDGESSPTSLANRNALRDLQMILVRSPPGAHVPIAERHIRFLKDLFRAINCDFKRKFGFDVPGNLFKHLMSFVSDAANQVPRKPHGRVPWVDVFTVHRPLMSHRFRFAFGDLGYGWDPTAGNSFRPRAILCTVVGRGSDVTKVLAIS